MRASAASQLAGSKSAGKLPRPFWPSRPGLRIHGRSRRAGPSKRSPKRRTLPQMAPSVSGLRASPSSPTSAPVVASTVIAKLQVSGQSRGQALGWGTWAI